MTTYPYTVTIRKEQEYTAIFNADSMLEATNMAVVAFEEDLIDKTNYKHFVTDCHITYEDERAKYQEFDSEMNEIENDTDPEEEHQ